MVQVQQRFLIAASFVAALAAPAMLDARRFYPDDPIGKVPPPMSIKEANERELSEYYDFFLNTFGKPGEPQVPAGVPAQAVNTLGEVPDSTWYTNRHRNRRMTIAELQRGPGDSNDPTGSWPWTVTGAKTQGITPGLQIRDARGRRYLLKFDPMKAPEIASGADVIGSKLFYALGYNTPENYVVSFTREHLQLDPKAKLTDGKGRERLMEQRDIERVLERVPRNADGSYRGLASFFLDGKPVGPFRYHGTRTDDPNDIVPHEHRRDLRGLYVFSAWLNHTDTKSINSLDMLVEENDRRYIRHHLIDFGAILGSDSFEPKSPRAGHVYLFDWKSSAAAFFTLGLYVPSWSFADFPHIRGVGHFEAEHFDADDWKNNYYNAAFVNCRPDDGFWAAKQVMAFTEPELRALVATARFSDPRATDYLVKTLISRQQNVGRTWFEKLLPLDRFRVENGTLTFDDLGVKHGFAPQRSYTVNWFRFDNQNEQRAPVAGTGLRVPATDSEYLAAEVRAGDPRKTVTVYLRRAGSGWEPVGVDRTW